jgi:pyruvate dehydrogenase E2 component (dihydrolipoamide acetyltransferase)
MPIEVIIPRLGWSMDEGLFGEWLINDGDFVNVGDMLFVLEGEKALQEIESFDEGILHIPADAPQSGDTVAVGQRLAYLLAEGESPPAPDTTAPVAENVENVQPAHKPTQPTEPVTRTANRVVASPRARRTARQLGVEWATIPGSGRNGRIRERDVIAAAQQSPAQAGLPKTRGTLQPPSKMRRTIAQRMLAAVQQTAPVTLTTKVDASQLFAARQRYKSSGAENAPSYNDILVQLVANSLPQFPELNASWINDAVYTYDEINIAIATDTPQGLLAPVLRNATELSLEEIAAESQRLTEQARSGQLTEEQLSGGTFTITNLGMFDIDHFTPIINLPQTAILGIGRIADEPVIAGDKVIPGKTLSLSLTFDHRVIDGAPAARWLQRLSELILQPQR